MHSNDRLTTENFILSMINTKATIMIFALATILMTGAITIAPAAYSTGYGGGGHDDSHDDSGCHDDSNDDSHGDSNDDSNGDCVPDPCDCKKPDKFTVRYDGPGTSDNPAVVEIYKKTDKIGKKDPIVPGRDVYVPDLPLGEPEDANQIMLSASDFNKEKLGSNAGYRILWDDDPTDDPEIPGQGLEEIARIDVHTSCSKLLYIGQTFTDGDVTLTVEDGTRNGETSIPISDPLTCEAPPEPTKFGSITFKKALTNDNDGDALPHDFVINLTRSDGTNEIENVNFTNINPSMGKTMTFEIPAGIYTLNELLIPYPDGSGVTADYTTVVVTGDTACPSMVGKEFEVKDGANITCSIYNDDNFNPNEGGGEGGIIFRNHSMMFQLDQEEMHDSCDKYTDVEDKDPCVEFVSPSAQRIGIVDSSLKDDTTIVLYSVVADGKICDDFNEGTGVCDDTDEEEAAPTPSCSDRAIVRHDLEENFFLKDLDDDSFPANPTSHLVFVLECTGMDTDVLYNINYIMIDPLALTS